MRNRKKDSLTLILIIALSVMLVPVLCFLGSGKGVSTGWEIPAYENSEGEKIPEPSVILSVEEHRVINKFYVYIGNVTPAADNKAAEFFLDWSEQPDSLKDSGTFFSTHSGPLAVDISGDNFRGWILVADNLDINRNLNHIKVSVSTCAGLKIMEMAFTEADGVSGREKQVRITGCEWGYAGKDGKWDYMKCGDTDDERYAFGNVCDEQDSYITGGVFAMSDRENGLSHAVDNLLHGTGGYVSEHDNVLGVELVSLGVLLFGNNSFGLRFVPFLFFAACVFLIFCFGKKLFRSPWGGFASSLLFMVSGLPLTLVLRGSAAPAALFFVLLAYYFAYTFYERTSDGKKVVLSLVYVILAGLMFTLAIAADIRAIVAIFGLLVFTVVPSVRGIILRKHEYKVATGLEKEYARERYVAVIGRSVAGILIAFVIFPLLLPLLFYLIGINTYWKFYDTGNLFKIMVINNARLVSGGSYGIFPSWLIGMGSEALPSAIGMTSYITANAGLVVLGFICFAVLLGIYFAAAGGKIKNSAFTAEFKLYKSAAEFIIIAFAANFLMLAVFGGRNSYQAFVYPLTFMILSPVMLFALAKPRLKKKALLSLAVLFCAVTLVFFALEFPLIYNIRAGEKIAAFYMWLV